MKSQCLLVILLLISYYSFGQSGIKTPTGLSVYSETDITIPDTAELAYCYAYFDSMIDANNWNAEIILNGSYKYNCHGYAWHISDGGDTVKIPNVSDVEKYFNGVNATYNQVSNITNFCKVYYDGAEHSAIADSNDLSYVWSKWGNGPLVRHAPNDCPYNNFTKKYYTLIIAEQPTTIAKGCATNISALSINGATYNWDEVNSYVCATGTQSTGTVTGLNITSGNNKGKVKVEISSPFSGTTVKGIKEIAVTSAPSNPYITGPSLVCSNGGSFTLHNVPPGNIITWSSSSNLYSDNIHANPCTFISTGNGSGWIDATVSTTCVESTFSISPVSVWSGAPVISNISGPMYTPNFQWATYYAEPNNSLMAATDYNWILTPLNSNVIYDYGWTADIAFYASGIYQLVVRAQNTCTYPGYGQYYGVTGLEVYDSRRLIINPNPSTEETTITIMSIPEEKAISELEEWEMEVYDQGQLLKEKKIRIQGKETKINTTSWMEGIYLVRVKYKDEILTGKLAVKK